MTWLRAIAVGLVLVLLPSCAWWRAHQCVSACDNCSIERSACQAGRWCDEPLADCAECARCSAQEGR